MPLGHRRCRAATAGPVIPLSDRVEVERHFLLPRRFNARRLHDRRKGSRRLRPIAPAACASVTPATGEVFDVLEAALALSIQVHRFAPARPDGPVENSSPRARGPFAPAISTWCRWRGAIDPFAPELAAACSTAAAPST
jgi:hypothetical protein